MHFEVINLEISDWREIRNFVMDILEKCEILKSDSKREPILKELLDETPFELKSLEVI
jgi:hypothetical protein